MNNIIRDTTSHNKALLAKESAESRARLKDLEYAEEKKRQDEQRRLKKLRPGLGDTRKRILGDIAAIIGGSSKKRKLDDGSPEENDERREKSGRDKRSKAGSGERADEEEDEHISTRRRRHDGKELPSDRDGKRTHTSRRRHRERSTSRSRSRSPERTRRSERSDSRREDGDRYRERDRHRHTSAKDSGRKGKSPDKRRADDLFDKRHGRESKSSARLGAAPATTQHENSDSDPLEELIGPSLPGASSPVRRRGRGKTSTTSGIESRFSTNYDPKADVSLGEEDDDDWGSALEALRDRQKWKQQGADRLRSAGFTDDQVHKWEKSDQKSDQKSEDDVTWRKKGEEREWDRGKPKEPGRL